MSRSGVARSGAKSRGNLGEMSSGSGDLVLLFFLNDDTRRIRLQLLVESVRVSKLLVLFF